MTQKIEISLKTILFTIGILLLFRIAWQIRDLFYALFLAFIFMSTFKPIVRYFALRKVPRFITIIGLFVVIISLLSVLVTFVIPPLLTESFLFLRNAPVLMVRTFPALANFINIESISTLLPDLTSNFVNIVSGLLSNFIFVISTIVFTFYFLSEEFFLKKLLNTFLSPIQVNRIERILSKAEHRMSAWLWGQVVLALVIGLMSYIGLSLLHIRFAIPLAIIAGFLEVAPIVGPIISAVPAFFVSASSSWLMGLSVIALYFLIQQIENNVVVPYVMKRAVGLHPIITLIALTIGGKLGGFLGILLSIPLALFVESIITEWRKVSN